MKKQVEVQHFFLNISGAVEFYLILDQEIQLFNVMEICALIKGLTYKKSLYQSPYQGYNPESLDASLNIKTVCLNTSLDVKTDFS